MKYFSSRAIFCIFAFVAVVACKPVVGSTAPAKATPLPPSATKEDWVKAIKAVYDESNTEVDGKGITEFAACFKRGKALAPDGRPKCELFSFAKYDAFNRITVFTPIESRLREHSSSKYLHSYVALLDCERPSIVLSPHFFGKNGWLFMERVAVMADGNIVLEHTFDHNDVQRDNNSWGVDERARWIASGEERMVLKKVVDSKAVIVRIIGDKGYVTVDKRDVDAMKADFAETLAIFDALDVAAASVRPASCN